MKLNPKYLFQKTAFLNKNFVKSYAGLSKNHKNNGLVTIFLKQFSEEKNKNHEKIEIKPYDESQKPKITRLPLDPKLPFDKKHKLTLSFLSVSTLSFFLGTFSNFMMTNNYEKDILFSAFLCWGVQAWKFSERRKVF